LPKIDLVLAVARLKIDLGAAFNFGTRIGLTIKRPDEISTQVRDNAIITSDFREDIEVHAATFTCRLDYKLML
jgi:hypothetical protein